MKAFKPTVLALSLTTGALLAGDASAQEITGFTHAGEGCPAGSVGHVYNPTTNTLTITFDDYSVNSEDNPSSACNVDAIVRVPRRLNVSWNKVQFLGFIDKGRGATAELRRRYQYDTNPPLSQVKTWPSSQNIAGQDFVVEDGFTGWSRCTNQVTVGMTSRMTMRGRPNRFSEMVMDRQHFRTKTIWTFGFRPC